MKKYFIICIVAVSVMAAIAIPIISANSIVKVSTAEAEKKDITVNLELSGEIQLTNTYTVTSTTAGVVSELPVREGSSVNVGDLLLHLDTSAYEQELRDLEEQKSTLEKSLSASANSSGLLQQSQLEAVLKAAQTASFDLNAFNEIVSGNAVASSASSDESLATATDPALLSSMNEIKAKEDALNTQIQNARFRSTISGTVLSVNVKQGELLAAGVPAITIGDNTSAEVVAYVTENDFNKVSEGMRCTFQIQGDSSIYTGTVSSLGAVISGLSSNEATDSKMVKIYIKPDDSLKCIPGSSVNVKIELNKSEDAISIPIEAVNDDQTVFIVNNGVLNKKVIKIGLFDNNDIEVVSGLETGDIVALESDTELHDGMRVTND